MNGKKSIFEYALPICGGITMLLPIFRLIGDSKQPMNWFFSAVVIVAAAAFLVGSMRVIQTLRQLESSETESVIAVRAIRISVAMTATMGFALAMVAWSAASELVRTR
jgi:hypothetical protein